MNSLMRLSEYLSQAILLEVSAYPKPGLVTRCANGSHNDMSLITFMMSSVVVSETFYQLFDIGRNFAEDEKALFKRVREWGKESEQKLLSSTKGVNTQRGILFAGGILAAAGGFLSETSLAEVSVQKLCDTVKKMTAGLVHKELECLEQNSNLTAGEQLFQKYRITGIRGEVEQGFPSVRHLGLPALYDAFSRGACINDALVQAMLSLMTGVEDSNVIWRTNFKELEKVQENAQKILLKGGVFSKAGRRELKSFDEYCIQKRISPGGTADLLSITVALFLFENGTFPSMII
ncbi:MAG: triphosphoribosyl-dephospho-CoA synthase CitG [Selenomonadaceae bacterium]